MTVPPALLQFLASLAAVLVVGGIVWWLKLGPERTLTSDAEARIAANEAVDGFDPVAVSLDKDGRGALLRDASGQILLLRPHGTHFAGRLLGPAASAQLDGEALIVDSGERRFGSHRLALTDASAWMQAIAAIEG
ncbi:hypothetical protein [Qipengyuania marisflavi]|uniref:Uncharacterized protein n=1 Tax=Qipengyuania marisflavi TaxID=2486356 RepID=A0A5S3P550_9SPHN|nr:hypothetical protein [Qipengyuania marisflavi]TMM48074.1 hypothetical protein FEV51_07150 [Qipengyuania marisflavi]